jgi:hypothetical protein
MCVTKAGGALHVAFGSMLLKKSGNALSRFFRKKRS